MFEDLFTYPKVLARHRMAPAAADQERYLETESETPARNLLSNHCIEMPQARHCDYCTLTGTISTESCTSSPRP
jgi:hypothetical protein